MLQVNQWLKRKERRGEGLASDGASAVFFNDDDDDEGDFPDTDSTAELLKLSSMLAGLDAEPLESLAAGAVSVHLAANQVRGVNVCSTLLPTGGAQLLATEVVKSVTRCCVRRARTSPPRRSTWCRVAR